ncbi:MAG: Fur family transcriptional regulator [Acidaminococcaceae bacterium]
MMLTSQELTATLREHGFKVTPQRLAVYEVLAGEKTHPSAEMLYSKLRPKYPSMSFATVYKTVEILHQLKLIQILNTGEDSYRYDADVSNHAHIQCTACGRVDDVQPLPLKALQKTVAAETNYEVQGQQFYFFGICAHCRQQN